MIVHATSDQALGILVAMRQVAEGRWRAPAPCRSPARPQGFWLAWERGSEITVDTFGPQWNFWAVVHEPVGTLRRRYGIPPLDPAVEATLALLEP